VTQLANLFWQLEHLHTAAITPTIELAKLALVTSRDEEEDEVDRGGTDSSNDTDATLVEDVPTRVSATEQPPHSPLRSSGTVLGKRLRDDPRQRGEMDVDSPNPDSERDKDEFVLVSSPTSPLRSSTPQSPGEGSSSKVSKSGEAVDVEMQDRASQPAQKAPPLPPRKNTISDSVMMFGKFMIIFAIG
jgi:ubiquitin carboxyl-terminal hydrolase 25/28